MDKKVYCENCINYNPKKGVPTNDWCALIIGKKSTPFKLSNKYADPWQVNEKNKCRYYKAK